MAPPQAPDPKVYYGYLFKPDKTPTDTLEALLRAIASYIIAEVGDKHETHLTPKKLAAFYRAAGGDYDRLFLEMPPSTISYIWSNIGCQHSLQPTEDDYAPPSVPALTTRGFVRWKAVEILLEPAVHVPFLQHAVQNWNLKRPDTGAPFPAPLPASAFPTEADAKMLNWHEEKLEALKAEAGDGTREGRPGGDAPGEDGEKAGEKGGERAGERVPPRRPSSPREAREPPRRSPHGHSPMASPMPSPRRPSPRRGGAPKRASDSSGEEPLRGRQQERRRGGGPADPAGGVHYVYPGRTGARRPADVPFSFQTVEEEEGHGRRSSSGHPSPTDRRRSPELSRQQQQQQHRGRIPPQQSRGYSYSQPRVRSPIIVSSDAESPSPRMRSSAQKYRSDPALHRMRGLGGGGGSGGGGRASVRHVTPGFTSPGRGHSPGLRPPASEPGERRKSAPADGVRDKLMNAVSSILYSNHGSGGGKEAGERQRSSSKTNSHASGGGYLRPDDYAARREDVDSDDSGDYNNSGRWRRGRRRRELERERELQRGRARERERGRERVEVVQAARDRDRDRDRDRERDRSRDGGARDRVRDRDRDRERDWSRDGGARERERERAKERHADVFEDKPLRPPPRRGSPYRRTAPHGGGGGGSRGGSWDECDGSRERAARQDRRRRDPHGYRD